MLQLPIINEEETITVVKSFIKTYVENAKINSIVLGFSGGIDSAVTAVLCAEVLGKSNVHCIFLPDNVTPMSDRKDVKLLIEKYDFSFEQRDITEIVNVFKNNSKINLNKLTEANIKARVRMILLYMHANNSNSLVCGTSNKSEILIGYFTKYGDGGIDFMPLGDIYKTDIFRIAKYLDLPSDLISKPPSAGLWEGQTDEKELKLRYGQLDLILWGLEQKMEYDKIGLLCNISIDEVKRIVMMRKKSQHKRRSALIPKIGLRTPGLDWRSPLQEG